MTIQELLRISNKEEIVDEFLKMLHEVYAFQLEYNKIDNEQQSQANERLKKEYLSFYEMLCSLKTKSSHEILMATRCYEFEGWNVGCNLYDIDELNKSIDALKTYPIPLVKESSKEQCQKIIKELTEILPPSYAFEYSSWDEILGAEVCMESVECYGLIPFLINFLWEVSFNGITLESQNERRRELEESIKEVELIQSLSKEEQEKYFHSTEELLNDLNIDKNDYNSNRDEETKYENELYEIAKSNIELANFLKTL